MQTSLVVVADKKADAEKEAQTLLANFVGKGLPFATAVLLPGLTVQAPGHPDCWLVFFQVEPSDLTI
ncbi:MAG TPA: hypothetical protein VGK71_00470 [Nitrospirota bacterium]